MHTPRPSHGLAAVLGTTTLLLTVAAGCGRQPATGTTPRYADFLGDSACAPCHAREFKAHRATRHAATMRPADRVSLGSYAPTPGEIPGTNFALNANGTGFALAVKDHPEKSLPLQLALGTGKFAVTYVYTFEKNFMIELRESYYPRLHKWSTTPGQEDSQGDLLGRGYRAEEARNCLRCHTVALPEDTVTPEPRLYGVGCESCHGPGRAHVEAVRAGHTSELQIDNPGKWEATKSIELCGRCHRLAKDVSPGETATQRFQPYGLMQSRCYQESGDKLSCLTCHDAHTDAATDPGGYEKVCLKCHPAPVRTAVFGPAPPGPAPCPVNPRSGCIQCHMPTRYLSQERDIAMADHFIRIHRGD